MKIATKILSGYGILILLMAFVVAYQVLVVNRLQAIHQNLTQVSFRASTLSLKMTRDLDAIEEFTAKSLLLQDPAYASERRELESEFGRNFQTLRGLATSQRERDEIDRLGRFWVEFGEALSREERRAPGDTTRLSTELEGEIERLRLQMETVSSATVEERTAEIQRAATMGERAKWISWSGATVALLLSAMVSVVILRSIAEPLRHLTEGTRAIAEGKFFYRLDTTRNDEFAQLAKDFNAMTERLNELDELKKGFVSHVSHELKAPLASMQETIHVLLEDIAGPLNEKQRRLLELNFDSGKRLSAMIGNLLDLSRLEAGSMEYELSDHDLGTALRNAIRQFETPAREKEVRIETDLPETVVAAEFDTDRITQALGNLLGNAIKFSPRGGTVQIALEQLHDLPDRLPSAWRPVVGADGTASFGLVSVSDSGPGVPDTHKEKIFEKFHQLKQGKKIPGQGVGLGLAICKIIVEAHRGAVWVEDNPGGGSIFRFLLRSAVETDVPRVRVAAAARDRRRTVL